MVSPLPGTVLFLLIIPQIIGTSVKVTRSNGISDRLEFTTTDRSICAKYSSTYVSYTSYSVSCKCTTTYPSFYSISSTSSPACHHSNAENLGKLDFLTTYVI